ncbi:putative DNA binding domain-containing protein [bacterium]|nr:putative DNA binding domain-containing protein [bacterium]
MSARLNAKIDEMRRMPGETEWFEFKVSNFKPQQIGEYISALANSACLNSKSKGYLIFGIEDQTHKAVGTEFQPKKEKMGNEELENWLIHSLDPQVHFSIIEHIYQEIRLVIFEINATQNRPVSFKGQEYIRVGSYKKKLSDHPEKEQMLWQKMLSQSFEEGIAKHNVTSDEVIELIDYPKYFRLMNIPLPENKTAILEKLSEERITKRLGDLYDITNLGAVLFAVDLSSFLSIARKAVRVIVYKGKNRLQTIKEQIGSKGYATGFERLVDYINDKLPANEILGKALRKEVKMYPEVAIRELVANALIHQDFSISGTSPMVEIFDDRIEISNAGNPLIDPLRFIDHPPRSRNEQLASFMRRINICEERGSGIDKVVASTEVYQLPAPEFIEGDDYVKAILYSAKSFKQMNKPEKIRACYQHCCLKYVTNEVMTNQSLRKRFNVSEKNYSPVSKVISDTIENQLIKESDPDNKSKKYAKYIPIWA